MFSITSMIRLMVLMAAGSILLAIGVSRLDPRQPERRSPRAVTAFNLTDYFLDSAGRKSHWLDARAGAMVLPPLPDDAVFEAASCSPWVDAAGHRQAVGRWSERTWSGPSTTCRAFGLARFALDEGRLINQVATDIVPISPPCWFPGTRARVLFPAGDGQLYRFAFESENPGDPVNDGGATADAAPVPVSWACPCPGFGDVSITQVSWPDDPRLGGRLLATLQPRDSPCGPASRIPGSQLWWLRLDHAATRIIAVGPLLANDPGESTATDGDERSPTVAALPDGTLGLAYAHRAKGEAGWTVRLAPLGVDADHNPIPADPTAARTLAAGCFPAPLAFSPDGRWLNAMVGDPGDPNSADRVTRLATLPPAPAPANRPR